jgi:hypothetical protein
MATETTKTVELPRPDIRTLLVRVVGDTSLIVHNWSVKAKKEILDAQQGKAKSGKKAPKDPEAECKAALYLTRDGKPGIQASAFKMAMVRAANDAQLTMTEARRMCFVCGDIIPVNGKWKMREDMVRNKTGVADIRFRPEFVDWSVDLEIRYNSGITTVERILNMLNIAGFSVGVAEWRPERNGPHGTFHVQEGKGKKS